MQCTFDSHECVYCASFNGQIKQFCGIVNILQTGKIRHVKWVINAQVAAVVLVAKTAINHMVTFHRLDLFTAKGLQIFLEKKKTKTYDMFVWAPCP